MIRPENIFASALAILLAAEIGHRLSMPARMVRYVPDIKEWADKNDIIYSFKNNMLVLERAPEIVS